MNKYLINYFDTIKKFLPEERSRSSVGLDIGAKDCKLVELKKEGDSIVLLNWAIEPVEGGNISSAIQKSMEHLENPCDSLYSAVFGKGTLIRYVNMPRMVLKDLRNSFDIEADKHFPFAQDQIYTDCYILNPDSKEKQMAVMAAAVKKEIIDDRMNILKELGLPNDFIGINSIALANIINILGVKEQEKESTAIALLDMGESVSSLTIIEDKIPRFNRDIYMGGRELTKRISNALGISIEQAEELKKQPKGKHEEVVGACEAVVMNIVQELRLSFDYFMSERNKEISLLLLTGGASILEGLTEVFEKILEVNVRKWDPMSYLEISKDLDSKEITDKSLKLGVAIGLALYEYD